MSTTVHKRRISFDFQFETAPHQDKDAIQDIVVEVIQEALCELSYLQVNLETISNVVVEEVS